MSQHQHEMEYEFEEGRFLNWRGDYWCRNCDYVIYSRENIRAQMFGMVSVINPPSKHEKNSSSADSAMFKISNLTVERR